MAADLDELFAALGRQADTLPLAGADMARDRGRQRNRTRAVLAVAAAVVLVVVGVGVTLRDPEQRATKPISNLHDPMPQVGPPIDLGGPVSERFSVHDGTRVYAAWVPYDDSSTWVTAADLRTGRQSWPSLRLDDPHRMAGQILVAPGALLVITRPRDGYGKGTGLYAFNPATGARLWQRDTLDGNAMTFTEAAIVETSVATHRTTGYDWVSGTELWSVPGAVNPVGLLAMTTPADEELIGQSGLPAPTRDPRIVTVTAAGQAEVRDSRTGQLQRSVPAPLPVGAAMVAYDGWLYSGDEKGGVPRLRATDLTGALGSRFVQTLTGELRSLTACGERRVCASTGPPGSASARATITAVDVVTGARLWRATAGVGGDGLSSAHGRLLVADTMGGFQLFDADGRSMFTSALAGGWLDADTLLVVAPDGTGREARWSARTRTITPIGAGPDTAYGGCSSTSTRLVCITDSGLRIWRVG